VIGCLAVVSLVAACGGTKPSASPPEPAQRAVAARFATALLNGDGVGARALLVASDDESLVSLVREHLGPGRAKHVSIRLPAHRTGGAWAFGFARRMTHRDGRFETQRGDLIVFVAPSARGAAVEFFAFRNVRRRFSTHHDAQLLPSKR
jgi:hypothetical protein